MYQFSVKEGEDVIARLGVTMPGDIALSEDQIQKLGGITEEVMAEIYPSFLLPYGDAQKRSLQSRNLLYSLIFFLSHKGFISKKDPFITDPENYPFKVLGESFSALYDVTVHLYNACEIANALDLLPYDYAYDHWLELVKEAAISECSNYRSTRGKLAASEEVRAAKEQLEKVFPDKKRRSRVKRIRENLEAPVENPFDPEKEPIGRQWLDLVIHVGTYSHDEAWQLRKPKKQIRDSFNVWVSSLGLWQRVLRQPKYNIYCLHSDGLKLVESKPRRKKSS